MFWVKIQQFKVSITDILWERHDQLRCSFFFSEAFSFISHAPVLWFVSHVLIRCLMTKPLN